MSLMKAWLRLSSMKSRKRLEIIKAQGITTILVEQNAVRALNLADRSVILDTGSVVFDGTAKEVLDNKELREEYLAI
jgi:branched-chain amino acid transport system ATP-binding protein